MFAATMSPSYSPTWVSGQIPLMSPIAHSPSATRSRRVDVHATRVGLDADGLESDVGDPRAPSGRDEQALAAKGPSVGEGQDVVVALAPRAGGLDADDDLDAVAPQSVGERLAQRRGLAGEQVRRALHERDLRAEAVRGLGELDPG